MAEKLKKFRGSILGKILTAVLYLVLLALVMIYFTGNGLFIYEAF